MVLVFEGTEKQYYLDGILKENLDIAKREIKKDWDMLFLVDGSEGSGKSTCAIQMAYYCDPTLDNGNVVFTPNQFRKVIMASKPYTSVVYDEAYTGLSSRATMSLINRTLISMLAEIRQRNLFIFVVMPTFFDLDKYVALWRSRALIHVRTMNGFERGYFDFYNAEKKKEVYVDGKKYYNYLPKRRNFYGRFTAFLPINEVQYKYNKRHSLINREKTYIEAEVRKEMEKALYQKMEEMGDEIPNVTKAKILGISLTSLYRWQHQKEEEKVMDV